MAEIIPFPVVRHAVGTLDARRVFTAGVDDELADVIPLLAVPMDCAVAVRYVSASQIAREGLETDLWISRHAPNAPDRRVLFETLANEIVEQDERGALWIDDTLLDSGLLVSVGSAEHDREGPLAPGDSAALLLVSRSAQRYEFVVEITSPILWVFEQPGCLAGSPVLVGWTGAALCLWRERERRTS